MGILSGISTVFNIIWWGTILSTVVLVAGYFYDPPVPIPGEIGERLAVRFATDSEDLGRRVNEALDEGDYDSALMYKDIADWSGHPLPAPVEQRLAEASTLGAAIWRSTRDFTYGFTTGEANSLAGFSGAAAADLTVIGDVRDIVGEGGKMLRDEPYNRLVLGLSVVGIGVTGTTLASGGATISGRVGVSIVKIGSKTGALTTRFAGRLTELVTEAVNFPALQRALRQADLNDLGATRRAMEDYAKTVRGSDLFPVLNQVENMRANTNAVETIRLMRYVETTDDLSDMTRMTERLGPRTRGVVEITGKRSMSALRNTVRAAKVITEYIVGFLAWGGGVLAAWLSRFGFRVLRAALR